MNKIIKIILLCIIGFLCAGIFHFSSQVATESNQISRSITKKVVDTLPKYRGYTETEKVPIVKRYNHYIRKYAHFILFFLLGIATFSLACCYPHKQTKALFFALLFCFAYGISDEIHQLFVPGRAFQIRDILIDWAGSLMGGCVVMLMASLFKKKSRVIIRK